MMKLAQPGPEHELLKSMEGETNIAFKYYMDKDATADGAGTGKNTMIMGGRFLMMENTTSTMGMTVKGMTILGFDRRKNKYTMFEIDEMGTYSVSAEGDYNADTKTLTLNGSELDPVSKKSMDFKFVYDLSKPNEHKFSVIFIKPDGSEFKEVEVIATKK
jgi:hypothetical protein